MPDREAPRRHHRTMHPVEPVTPVAPRALRRTLFRQNWRDLVFLHWPADPFQVAGLLPPGTVPDLHNGRTYVGLVFFRMRDLAVGGETEEVEVGKLLRLDLVQIVIAADEQQVECLVVHDRDCLNGLREREAEERRDVLAARLARRRHLLHRRGRGGARSARRDRLRELDVRRVVGLRAIGDRIEPRAVTSPVSPRSGLK